MNTPLSADDIVKKIGCNYVPYYNIHKLTDIKQLTSKPTLILYYPEDIGHFVCMFKNKEGINYFDSMGQHPDEIIGMKDEKYHDFTYITQLLANSDEKINYNDFDLQKDGTMTCGHWCTIRLLYRSLGCDEFNNVFKKIHDRDRLIVKLYNSF